MEAEEHRATARQAFTWPPQRTWEGFRKAAGEKRLRAKPECAKDMDFGSQWESSTVTIVTEKRSLFGLC